MNIHCIFLKLNLLINIKYIIIKIIVGVNKKNKFFIIKSEINRIVVSENIIINNPVKKVIIFSLK